MSKTNGWVEQSDKNRGSQEKSNRWLNVGGIFLIVAIVVALLLLGHWARQETHKHTLACNPLGTDIIGMNLETVKKVCGEPWSEHYEGIGRYLVKITLHYSGGDIYVTAHGANLVGDQVTGWSK